MRYFDQFIEQYPHQAEQLRAAKQQILEEAFSLEDFGHWLKEPTRYPELANIRQGLRGRIKTHLKPFLRRERQMQSTADDLAMQSVDLDLSSSSTEHLLDEVEDGDGDGEL